MSLMRCLPFLVLARHRFAHWCALLVFCCGAEILWAAGRLRRPVERITSAATGPKSWAWKDEAYASGQSEVGRWCWTLRVTLAHCLVPFRTESWRRIVLSNYRRLRFGHEMADPPRDMAPPDNRQEVLAAYAVEHDLRLVDGQLVDSDDELAEGVSLSLDVHVFLPTEDQTTEDSMVLVDFAKYKGELGRWAWEEHGWEFDADSDEAEESDGEPSHG